MLHHWDVHQFIGHCLIPLDLCNLPLESLLFYVVSYRTANELQQSNKLNIKSSKNGKNVA